MADHRAATEQADKPAVTSQDAALPGARQVAHELHHEEDEERLSGSTAARAGRGGAYRRCRSCAYLHLDHAASDEASARHVFDLRLHLELERLPRAVAVPEGPEPVLPADRAASVRRPDLDLGLRGADGDGRAGAHPRPAVLPCLPAVPG